MDFFTEYGGIMSNYNIYEVGAMLGLKPKDIRNILSRKSMINTKDSQDVPLTPMEIYPKGTLYGTINLKDFQ